MVSQPAEIRRLPASNDNPVLEFIYVDIARDFVGVAFHDLLGAKDFHNNWNSCFDPPHSLKLLWGRGV